MPGETWDFSENNMVVRSGFGPFSDGAYDHGGQIWMSTGRSGVFAGDSGL